jgi:hypothetical protein
MINNVQTNYSQDKHTRNKRELSHIVCQHTTLNTMEGLKYLGKKFTLVNVQISSANTTSLDFDLSKRMTSQQIFLQRVHNNGYRKLR